MLKIQEPLGAIPSTPKGGPILVPASRVGATLEGLPPRKHPLWIRPFQESPPFNCAACKDPKICEAVFKPLFSTDDKSHYPSTYNVLRKKNGHM